MPFIYKIINDINDQVYIGKTETTIAERWSKHIWSCKNTTGSNQKLYNAMRKYGIDNFHIVQIEECTFTDISEREIYWIQYYDSYNNGYNSTIGGDGCPKYDRDYILQLWQEGYNQKEISNIIHCDRHTISRVLKVADIPEEERLKFKKQGNASKEVCLLNKDTLEIIGTFKSASEAIRSIGLDPNKNCGLVSRACHDLNKSAYGYKWIFKKDIDRIGEKTHVTTD